MKEVKPVAKLFDNTPVIQSLEALLEMAKRGEVVGFIYAYGLFDGSVSTGTASTKETNALSLLAGLEILKVRFMAAYLES